MQVCDCGRVEGGVEDEDSFGFWGSGGGRGCEDFEGLGRRRGGHCLLCVMAAVVRYVYCIVESKRG